MTGIGFLDSIHTEGADGIGTVSARRNTAGHTLLTPVSGRKFQGRLFSRTLLQYATSSSVYFWFLSPFGANVHEYPCIAQIHPLLSISNYFDVDISNWYSAASQFRKPRVLGMQVKGSISMSVTALRQETTPALSDADTLTLVCKALADGLRLEILRLLSTSSFGVLELCRILDIRQSALSHHLKILATAGLATTRREGNTIFYRRPLLASDDPLHSFKKSAFETIDRVPLSDELRERMNQIQRERSEQSLQFFTRHADKFREKQGLVAEHSQYTAALQDLLHELEPHAQRSVMEVGPGQGELIPMFAERFNEVIALDNAKEMLNQARATAEQASVTNARFIHGDTSKALELGVRCDLIVFDMVLHHLASPREAFTHAKTLLNDNGLLLIVDLCRHNQDWVKESCGDLWLGFEQEELEDWASQAGLPAGQTVYLGLRNGFQIQMCVFHKNPNHA